LPEIVAVVVTMVTDLWLANHHPIGLETTRPRNTANKSFCTVIMVAGGLQNRSAWASGYGFRPIRCFLWEDFNPFWSIDFQHHFFVKNIDDGHDHFAIDDDGFVKSIMPSE
jgi:hypothetical protein